MHGRRRTRLLTTAALVLALSTPGAAVAAGAQDGGSAVTVLARGLGGGSGSTIGPDGHLYVTEPIEGAVTQIDRRTGAKTQVADCLPPRAAPLGGAMDVAFLGKKMYVLATYVGGEGTTGLYRVDGRRDCPLVAEIGRYNAENPAPYPVDVATGVPYAMQRYGGAFLVTDGHLNRVLKVRPDGRIRTVLQMGNVVPTGLDRADGKVLLALAGPVPHLPRDGKVLAFRPGSERTRLVASGGRLLVDVEFGPRHCLYALAQGVFPADGAPGTPATPSTGRLLRVDDGSFDVVAGGLDRPTSLEIVGDTAFVVTFAGQVLKVNLPG